MNTSADNRVLLIEDNEQNAYLAKFLLEQSGMMVTHVRTGADGLRVTREDPHRLILLDIQLPDMNGYDIATQLRQDRANDGIRIVALTSYAMPGERQKALDSGCNGYIEKPISPLKFVEQVKSFLT
jgi:two-component system, cell cycle response regulator DivK